MLQYLKNLKSIRDFGIVKTDRTGTGTQSLFGEINMSFQLQHHDVVDGVEVMRPIVPLLTTKAVHMHAIKEELEWMLDGSTNVHPLQAKKVRIWNEWADANGELGPIYGYQWRKWPDTRVVMQSDWNANQAMYESRGYRMIDNVSIDHEMNGVCIHRSIDQIAIIENQLRNSPDSRRIILSGWNVAMIEEMSLPPCHTLAQWAVHTDPINGDQVLDCKMYQRSADFFLGVPFNIVQYAVFTHMLAKAHGMRAGRLHHSVGDAHIYSNHMEQVDTQLERTPSHEPAFIHIEGDFTSILQIKPEHISISNYNPQPAIAAKVAV